MAQFSSRGALRGEIYRQRAALSPTAWRREDEQRQSWVLAELAAWLISTVALYVAKPGEPATAGIISALHERGWRVLLPVLRSTPDWAEFAGWDQIAAGPLGIGQPTGRALGAAALGEAELIICPGLAFSIDGTRLGTGGGWYDRALLHRRQGVPVWLLARSGEQHELIAEPHDVAVTDVVTELGRRPLGG